MTTLNVNLGGQQVQIRGRVRRDDALGGVWVTWYRPRPMFVHDGQICD